MSVIGFVFPFLILSYLSIIKGRYYACQAWGWPSEKKLDIYWKKLHVKPGDRWYHQVYAEVTKIPSPCSWAGNSYLPTLSLELESISFSHCKTPWLHYSALHSCAACPLSKVCLTIFNKCHDFFKLE